MSQRNFNYNLLNTNNFVIKLKNNKSHDITCNNHLISEIKLIKINIMEHS